MKQATLYLFMLSLITMACSDSNKPKLDEEAPKITILSPENGATFESGASILLNVVIEENLELHEYTAVLRGTDNETAFTVDAGHSHGKILTIEKTFKLPDLTNAAFNLTIKANDHDNNLETTTINLYTN